MLTGNTKHYSSKAIYTYYFGLIWKYIVEQEKSKIVTVIFVNVDLLNCFLYIWSQCNNMETKS